MASYLRAGSVDAALEALAEGERSVLAGGTDWYPARVGRPPDERPVLDIGALAELRGVIDAGDYKQFIFLFLSLFPSFLLSAVWKPYFSPYF